MFDRFLEEFKANGFTEKHLAQWTPCEGCDAIVSDDHKDTAIYLVKEHKLEPAQAIKEISGIVGRHALCLKSLYANGLRSNHLQKWRPSPHDARAFRNVGVLGLEWYFSNDHINVLSCLIKEYKLEPYKAVLEMSELNSEQLLLLKEAYPNGLRGEHIRHWKPSNNQEGSVNFKSEHKDLVIFLIRDRNETPEKAIQKINGCMWNEARTIHTQLLQQSLIKEVVKIASNANQQIPLLPAHVKKILLTATNDSKEYQAKLIIQMIYEFGIKIINSDSGIKKDEKYTIADMVASFENTKTPTLLEKYQSLPQLETFDKNRRGRNPLHACFILKVALDHLSKDAVIDLGCKTIEFYKLENQAEFKLPDNTVLLSICGVSEFIYAYCATIPDEFQDCYDSEPCYSIFGHPPAKDIKSSHIYQFIDDDCMPAFIKSIIQDDLLSNTEELNQVFMLKPKHELKPKNNPEKNIQTAFSLFKNSLPRTPDNQSNTLNNNTAPTYL